ncbi:YrdB family protein [Lactiplantibacillus paraplantarum]|uniref:YrdB family protein n=1 Tax=Lactiplantibacillus paraplantarum TaxID=60520 RepID=UPI0023AB567E|nr:YrdB family protein [Lactiplantibacillus paraplantarum]WEE35580.1 YrdB family protein [Lactiplantibacillus paraplantarum]
MIKLIHASIRCLLEMTTIILFLISGLRTASWQRITILLTLLLLILFWSRYMAPLSASRWPSRRRLFVECLLFGSTIILTYSLINPIWASVYAVIAIINTTSEHLITTPSL